MVHQGHCQVHRVHPEAGSRGVAGQECHSSARLQGEQQYNGVQQGLAPLAAVVLCGPACEVCLQVC